MQKQRKEDISVFLRKLSKHSIGLSVPHEVVIEKGFQPGDLVKLTIEKVNRDIPYSCLICCYNFIETEDELEPQCPACGEKRHLLNMETQQHVTRED